MSNLTLSLELAESWKRWPERIALVSGESSLTYDYLRDSVRRLASAYRRLGIRAGDRVICRLANRPEQFVAMIATWTCRSIHVGIDAQSTAFELDQILELTRAKIVIVEASTDIESVVQICRNRTVAALLVLGDCDGMDCLSWTSVLENESPAEAGTQPIDESQPEDPALIFISSGTTGRPKATVGYHGNLASRWIRLGKWLSFSADDSHLAQLPLSHGFGLMMSLAAQLNGGRLVLMRRFVAADALQQMHRYGVTVLNGAPAHFRLVLDALAKESRTDPFLRLSVGTAGFFPKELVEQIWEKLAHNFMFMYGASEGVGIATTNRDDIIRGSVGRPAEDSVAIVDENREVLPAGESGEIAFARKQFPVRYWTLADCQSSPQPESDGWYYSGDLGRLDNDGRLYVFGRIQHQIDRVGLKVDPIEVEAALSLCPGVSDAAAIGVPNPMLGESVCACIVPSTPLPPTLEQIRGWLADRLAPHKLPEELCCLSEIPRTQLGKLSISQLQAVVREMPRQSIRKHPLFVADRATEME